MRWLHAVKSVGNRRLFLKRSLSPNYIISTLLTSNFIGIVVARTLHYQFYAWYFHALPFILWNSDTYPVVIRILLLIAVESSFLTYPATPISSAILQAAHLAILLQVKPSEPISDVKAKSPKRKGE
jgi:alpha-1,3-mannosyltransferase